MGSRRALLPGRDFTWRHFADWVWCVLIVFDNVADRFIALRRAVFGWAAVCWAFAFWGIAGWSVVSVFGVIDAEDGRFWVGLCGNGIPEDFVPIAAFFLSVLVGGDAVSGRDFGV